MYRVKVSQPSAEECPEGMLCRIRPDMSVVEKNSSDNILSCISSKSTALAWSWNTSLSETSSAYGTRTGTFHAVQVEICTFYKCW